MDHGKQIDSKLLPANNESVDNDLHQLVANINTQDSEPDVDFLLSTQPLETAALGADRIACEQFETSKSLEPKREITDEEFLAPTQPLAAALNESYLKSLQTDEEDNVQDKINEMVSDVSSMPSPMETISEIRNLTSPDLFQSSADYSAVIQQSSFEEPMQIEAVADVHATSIPQNQITPQSPKTIERQLPTESIPKEPVISSQFCAVDETVEGQANNSNSVSVAESPRTTNLRKPRKQKRHEVACDSESPLELHDINMIMNSKRRYSNKTYAEKIKVEFKKMYNNSNRCVPENKFAGIKVSNGRPSILQMMLMEEYARLNQIKNAMKQVLQFKYTPEEMATFAKNYEN